jgi:cell division protein ZapE
MTPPDRFYSATFDSYVPQTPSQAEALSTARWFAAACRKTPSLFEQAKRFFGLADTSTPEGLYLVGPAGTGKTHLLAATHHALTPEVPCAFMHSSTLFRRTEPPAQFAHALADRYAVCCLDEVEIDDPANEMRLVQFMKTLAARNVPLMATSNVTPDTALSNQFSSGRLHRFLRTEFAERYRIVEVRGTDYRRTQNVQRDGRGWIGSPEHTRPAMRQVYRDADGTVQWQSFDDFRRASTNVAHDRLIDTLTAVDHFFLEEVSIANTDDALRLLRVIDALYLHDEAPTLYFTSTTPPDAWFAPDAHAGVAEAVAEKFARTVSRLYALCTIREAEGASSEARPS